MGEGSASVRRLRYAVAPHILGGALLLAASAVLGANLLVNPGFEEVGKGGVPVGWALHAAAGKPTLTLDPVAPHAGAASLCLSGASPGDRAFAETAGLPVEAGKTYLFSAWVRAENVTAGGALLGAGRSRADGSWDGWSYVARLTPTPEWREFRQVWAVPDGVASISFRVWAEYFAGTVWFDDVALTEYASPVPVWADDFRQPELWLPSGAAVSSGPEGLSLRCTETASDTVQYPMGCVSREVRIDLDQGPILALNVLRVRGLWGLDVGADGPYVQLGSERTGIFLYDLRKCLGWSGQRTFPLRLFAMGEGAEVSVSRVQFLAETPPAVEAAARPRSRYADPGISLAGLDRARGHPCIAFSRSEIERLRERGAPFDAWLKRTVGAADRVLAATIEIPEQGMVYSMRYFCPTHGVPLSFDSKSPTAHRCPVDNAMLTGAGLDAEWRIQRTAQLHGAARRTLLDLGTAFQFTQEQRYADRAGAIFTEYARRFGRYVYHSSRGVQQREGEGMRVASEPLGEAGWLAEVAAAYDLVVEALPPATRQAVEQMLREDVRVSLRYDEGLSNRQCHHNLAIASVGLCLGDDELIRAALGSLQNQLTWAILDDGFWWEGSPGYHFYAVRTILALQEILARSGLRAVGEARAKLAFDGPLRVLLPDARYPAVNDTSTDVGLDRAPYEFLYAAFQDPRHAALLETTPGGRAQSEAWMRHGIDLGPREPLLRRSDYLAKTGQAALRAGSPGRELALVMHFGPAVLGHGHSDALGILLWANGKTQAVDVGSRSYFSPVWRFWDRQTLSHNTVVVDERSGQWERGRFAAFAALPGLQVGAAAADEAYAGLRLDRTLFLTDSLAADILAVSPAAGEGPSEVITGWIKQPQDVGSREGVLRGMVGYERSLEARSGRSAAAIRGSTGRNAAWASQIQYRTGQNILLRRGVLAIAPATAARLSVWVRTQDASGETSVALEWLNPSGGRLGLLQAPPEAGTTPWHEVVLQGTSPQAAVSARIWLNSNDNSGAAWFDDVALSQPGAPSPDAALHNFGFETTAVPHQTVDWLYHNSGRLEVDQALRPDEAPLGSSDEEPWADGANGYRFVDQRRWGEAAAGVTAVWYDGTGTAPGLSLAQAAAPATRLLAAEGQGPGATRLPMLMARRPGQPTSFLTALLPFQGERPSLRAVRVPGVAAGAELPDWMAAGLRVERADGADLFLRVAGSREPVHFGPVVLAGRWGAVLADGATYLLDGSRIEAVGGTLIETVPSPRGRVVDCLAAEGVVTTEVVLPEGTLLRDCLLLLERPFNEAFRIDRIERRGALSAVVLADRPQLAVLSGTPFAIPNAVAVRPLTANAYQVWCTAPVSLSLPRRVQHAAVAVPGGALQGVAVRATAGGTALALDPVALGGRELVLVLDGPQSGPLAAADPAASARLARDQVPLLATAAPLQVVALPDASGGRAVRLADPAAGLSVELPVPIGAYELRLLASGPDLGSNSLWIEIDGARQEDVAHLAVPALGPSSRTVEMEPLLPRIQVKGAGPHRLRLTLRESPGVLLDRIELLQNGKVVWSAEAEALAR
jgi:hypothetical protein